MTTLTFTSQPNDSSLSLTLSKDSKIFAKIIVATSNRSSELIILEIEKLLKSQNIWYENLKSVTLENTPHSSTTFRIHLTIAKMITLAVKIPMSFKHQ